MKTVAPSRSFEFTHQRPYNVLLVEEWEDKVIVRAAIDTFSDERKAIFVRGLAAEGFIPDRYQWYSGSDHSGYAGVTWVIDQSWLANTPALMRRKAAPWIAAMFAGAGVLLLVVMGVVVTLAH